MLERTAATGLAKDRGVFGTGYNPKVDEMRDREYPMLKGKTYLDHGGTTLYAKSLIDRFAADMNSNLYGNPHSNSTPSYLSGHRVDEIRLKTLQFFNANPEHFDLVFVSNCTAAIKLINECIRDYAGPKGFWYGYHRDAHTSIVGVREMTAGHHRCFSSDAEVERWIAEEKPAKKAKVSLFAYPGQSNMTGRRLPLSWPEKIRTSRHGATTYTLFDAAALATTTQLDLSDPETAPDFVTLSFYKIFGFPNIGALIIRKHAGEQLLMNRKYFGGGTVDMVISIGDSWHANRETSLHDRLEDGTLPFHSIFALDTAMAVHKELFGSMKQISAHTAYLARRLHGVLIGLTHWNGQPVVRIYKDENAVYGDPVTQGATIAFNVCHSDGSLVGYKEVEKAADEHGIYVRSGGLCNPGGIATYLKFQASELKAAYAAGHRCTKPTEAVHGRATGVVRVSLGAMSTLDDIVTFLEFMNEEYVEHTIEERYMPMRSDTSVESEITTTKMSKLTPREAKKTWKARLWAKSVADLLAMPNKKHDAPPVPQVHPV